MFASREDAKKMAPKIGAIGRKLNVGCGTETKAGFLKALDSQGLETEVRKVTIADGDARAGHQQAVDRRHQAAEQRAGRYQTDGSSLGHLCPLSWLRNNSAS